MLAVLFVLVATALATGFPSAGIATGHSPRGRPATPLFDRSHPGRLSIVDPLRPRSHRKLRKRALTSVNDIADPGRLPDSLLPTFYSLTLTPHLYDDFDFDGKAVISFNATSSTNKIILHSKELNYTKEDCQVYEDSDDSSPSEFASITDLQFNTTLEFAKFTLDKSLEAGSRYILNISQYSGTLNDDMDGFYRSHYTTSSNETRWLATSHFEPNGARRAFPCWDEPIFKARYDIFIEHDPALMAISNMPRQSQVESDHNFTTWAREDIITGGSLSQDVGPKALKVLEEFNGVPYTLTKMDQAAIPDFPRGAMENWGLVSFWEPDLIVTADTTTPAYEDIATLICHEFGHQWTGDLVTLDWWSHTWLNEGFATFYENMICNQIRPEWNLEDKMLPTFYHTAMESDVKETEIPMSSPVKSNVSDINDHFGSISYKKGGSVIRMFYYALTPEVFKKGMKRYLSDNMYANADPEKLFTAMDAEATLSNLHQLPGGTSFSEVASTWTEQPGVPVLQATRDYSNPGKVRFEQQRFLYAPPKNASNVGQKWWIPLVVTTQTQKDFSTTLPQGWLAPDQPFASLSTGATADEWVYVNPKQTGYFRVNYDAKNWQLLAAALSADPAALPASGRAQLLNDALTLARAGQLDYTLALPFLQSLKAERGVAPWQAATAAIKYLLARLDTTETNDSFLSLIKDVTADAYASVGYRKRDSDAHEAAYLRYIVSDLACRAGNTHCLSEAAAALKAWLADPSSNPLQVDTRRTTLCYGIRGSDAATFEKMRQKWLAEQNEDDRFTYASALGCTKDKSLVRSLLADAIALKYNSSDGVMLFDALYGHMDNLRIFLQLVKENGDETRKAFGHSFDARVLAAVVRDFRARKDVDEVRPWLEAKYKSSPDWKRLEAAFEHIDKELQSWGDKYLEKVSLWLFAANASPTITPTPSTLPPTDATIPPTNPTIPEANPTPPPTDSTPLQTNPTNLPTDPTLPPTNPTLSPTDPSILQTSTNKPSAASTTASTAVLPALALVFFSLCL
ncbi:aminopeptidase N-like isoform X2 [Thrips palmi]|uniref:Aminopeptidase N-like isoform X2 n=1 Tax=Thrips palmi TaxID=161013 RepID=A0A6P8ZVJ7_THRPL|nr:aminopeptidase N-like isoform X2 [Thrips palmi]